MFKLNVQPENQLGSFHYPPTLVHLLRQRAEQQCDDCAFTYLIDGEQEEINITYAELDREARAIAVWLLQHGLSGERALLAYPAGLKFVAAFFGCLYAGVVAVPVNPPRRNSKLSRIESIVHACDPKIALTTTDVLGWIKPVLHQSPNLLNLQWQSTDCLEDSAVADDWIMPDVSSATLAFLQYTSGSTGMPNGVMLSHNNLMHNSALTHLAFEHTRNMTGVFWLPNYHDMGLIGGILQPLYVGRPIVLMSPMKFLQQPMRWLKAITRYRGTTSGGPNFAYDLCVDKISEEQIEELDLTSWQVAFNGAEPIRAKTIERFSEKFAPCGFRREAFYPCYGLAEATLLVSGGRVPEQPVLRDFDALALSKERAVDARPDHQSRRLVGCGKPLPDEQVRIVDAVSLAECANGEVGEIWIAGPSIAHGYWNEPEVTEQVFHARLPDSGEGPFLRTGDLGFMVDGELFVTGRVKDLIIVRGTNHYPQDIEYTVEHSHPALRTGGGAAFSIDVNDNEGLVVVHEIERRYSDLKPQEIFGAIGQAVLEHHELTVHAISLIKPLSLPRTTSGKVARRACRKEFQSGTLRVVHHWERSETGSEFVSPRNRVEAILVGVWEDVLGVDRVGIHDNFFDLGGASTQSLEAAALAAKSGIEFEPAKMFQFQTISELADACANGVADSPLPVTPVESPAGQVNIEACEGNGAVAMKAMHQQDSDQATKKKNLLIESLGVYLPEKIVSTSEVVKGCRKDIWFPMQTMTGIKNRRQASKDELSIGMAIKAVEECLRNSKYRQQHIDLVVCCNISRCDVHMQYSCEPSSSMKLKNHFGFENALIFDISNACAGMFTGIKLVEAFLAVGAIRCGMVVSGEYITQLTETAQKEIEDFFDPRLACLTVGDSGAAVILESASNNDVGFHAVELYTVSEHADLCIGRFTDQEHGGAIMHTDPIKHTAVAIEYSVRHAVHMFKRSPWPPEKMNHILMHQTSDRSLRNGARALNSAFKKKICNKQNIINNLAERGNTATTTHFVALWDRVADGTLKSGDNVLFAISGSGQSVGTAIYTFDDFPDRLRHSTSNGGTSKKLPLNLTPPIARPSNMPRIRIEAVGTLPPGAEVETTIAMCEKAGQACFNASRYERDAIDVLNFAGVYRTDTIQEPAISALIGNTLKINPSVNSEDDQKTLCFDVFNGSLGLLNACDMAIRLINAETCKTAMVFASEIEANARDFPDELIGLKQTASAFILDQSDDGQTGFGEINFRYFPEFYESYQAYGVYRDGSKHFLHEQKHPRLHELMINCIVETVQEYLSDVGLDIADIKAVLAPQISSGFISDLRNALQVPTERMVDIVAEHDNLNLYSSSLPFSFQAAVEQDMVQQGDVGLIIGVGSGIQVGCALYYF